MRAPRSRRLFGRFSATKVKEKMRVRYLLFVVGIAIAM